MAATAYYQLEVAARTLLSGVEGGSGEAPSEADTTLAAIILMALLEKPPSEWTSPLELARRANDGASAGDAHYTAFDVCASLERIAAAVDARRRPTAARGDEVFYRATRDGIRDAALSILARRRLKLCKTIGLEGDCYDFAREAQDRLLANSPIGTDTSPQHAHLIAQMRAIGDDERLLKAWPSDDD